jgi:ribose transport system permease protein
VNSPGSRGGALMEQSTQEPKVDGAPDTSAGAAEGRRGLRAADIGYRYALVFGWLAMAVVFAILRPSTFLTGATVQIVFGSQSVLVVLTLSLLITLAVGEFDLSVASTMGLAATLIAVLNGEHGVPVFWAILAALAAGCIVGAVNGVLVVNVGVDAIVATLGMGTLLLGIALAISNSLTIGNISQGLQNATNNHFLGLPKSFWYGMVIAAIFWYVLQHTPLGRHLLFVGRNRDVSRLAGIRVERIRFGAFVACGFVAALAGVILAGTLGAFQASTSPDFLLPAFAAAFLGSTVVNPGRFNPWGSVIAIYFLITGITGLELLGLSGWIEQVFYGAALMAAVTLSTLVRRRFVD